MSLATSIQYEDYGSGFSRITNRPLEGRPVAVIGGGPSFDPRLMRILSPTDPILTNNAYMLTKRPSVVVAFDARWYGWHGSNLKKLNHFSVAAIKGNMRPPATIVFDKENQKPWTDVPHQLSGKNSGHGAVSLAIRLGATSIYLFGFDMTFRGSDQSKTHWHTGHKIPSTLANYENRFRPDLEDLAEIAYGMGVRVLAATPSSAKIEHVSTSRALDALEHAKRLDNIAP